MRLFTRILAPLVLLLALLLPAGPATSAPASVFEQPISANAFNPCNFEQIAFNGTYRVVTIQNENGTFNQFLTISGKGIGNQGNEYIFTYTENTRSTTANFTADRGFHVVSKGSAPNYWLKTRFTDQGVDFGKAECRG